MTDAAPALSYPFSHLPLPGQAIEIKPGVLWLRMPLPFSLDHINLWVLSDGSGWAVVDTGIRSVDVMNAWFALFAPQGPLAGRPVSRVMATHMHPDHVGMAGWLTRRFECALWMTRDEYLSCRVMLADSGREAPVDGVRFYRRAGWSDTEVDEYRTRFGDFGKMIHPLPDSFVRLTDGQMLRIGNQEWEVIVGTGHSPEHACFYSRELDLLISGDQVLPRISSNTSVYATEPHANPLQGWLDSIDRLLQRVPGSVLVLPAHNEPFYGRGGRVDEGLGLALQSRGLTVCGRHLFGEFQRLRFSDQIQVIAKDLKHGFWNENALVVANSFGAYLFLHAQTLLDPFPGKVLLLSPIIGATAAPGNGPRFSVRRLDGIT